MDSTEQARRRAVRPAPRRRRRRVAARLAPLVATVVVVWFAATSPGAASSSPVVAAWEMDEAPGAATLVDSGPWGIDGGIGTSVRTGVQEQGAVAHRREFVEPDTSPVDSQRLAVVAHDPRLDPGSENFAVTVRLRTTSLQGNIVQKGQSTVKGGYFKIDMDQGRVACVFIGDRAGVHLGSSVVVADGAWHEVRCLRTATEALLVIDGSVVTRRSVVLGTTANTWPVTIAGKISCNQVTVGCDYFSGDLDRVRLDRSSSIDAPDAPTTSVVSTEPTSTSLPTSSSSSVPTTTAPTTAPPTSVRPTTTTVRPTTTTTEVPVVK